MGDNINTLEPEVTRQVMKEVKDLTDGYGKQIEAINKNFVELKATVDAGAKDALDQNKLAKLAEDITTRQEAIDKNFAEMQAKNASRIDSIETAMNRLPRGGQSSDLESKEAKEFFTVLGSLKDGLNYQKAKSLVVDIEAFKRYKDALMEYIVNPGDGKSLTAEQFKALSVGNDPDGGYTVTPQMAANIITKTWESSPIRDLASVENITTSAIEWLVDWSQAGAGWETETAIGAVSTTPDIRKLRVPVHPMYARALATQMLLEDSGINVEQWLGNHLGLRFGRVEATAFVSGNGIGRPRGFLTYASGTAWGQIQQVNMGAIASLTADGFVDIKYSLLENFLNLGTWVMNRSTVAAAMKLKNGDGDYIWKPSQLAADPSSAILGLPVRMATDMPAIAANALAVALADWKSAYMIVDRLGITIQRDAYTQKPFVEFYARKRVGGDVVNYDAIKLGIIHV